MPLAVSLLGSTFNTSSGTKTVTAAPSVGDLIVIITAHTGNVSTATPTDNNSSGVYLRFTGAIKNSLGDLLSVHVRTALIGSASSTVFSHAPGASTGGGLAVLSIAGADAAGISAVRQYASVDELLAGGTPAPAFSTAALASSAVIGAVFSAANLSVISERAIYTELLDTGYATPSTGVEIMSVDSGETGTTITWGGPSSGNFCDLIIEFYGPSGILPALFVNTNDFHTPDVISTTYPLTLSLVTNSTSFHAPTVTPGSRTVAPPLFANSNSFYAPTVSGAGALSPSLFANTNTFYGPTIAPGAVTLHPALFVNSPQFGAAFIGTVTNIAPPLFANENTFYGATLGGWTNQTDDATVWTPQVNTSALTDENGNQILDESGNPITAEGDETWTAVTNDTTTWTEAA